MTFELKDVVVAGNDCGEDDWESVRTDGRFDLAKEDGEDDLINDDCDKYSMSLMKLGYFCN